MKLKKTFSHYGPEGPRNIGILIRMNRASIMFVFWKWYLELEIIK